jgi:PAS domain S-box-containing protein
MSCEQEGRATTGNRPSQTCDFEGLTFDSSGRVFGSIHRDVSAYLLLPLISCIGCSILATAILAWDSRSATSRLSAALVYGGAFWALCEVLWMTSADPEVALRFVKLSALGWVLIGPLALQLMIEVIGEPAKNVRSELRALYLASALFLVIDWTTPWIHTRVVETPWAEGWSYELGHAYPFYWSFTVAALVWGLVLGFRAYGRLPSEAERRQARWFGAGIMAPLVIGSVTDGVLPWLGIQVIHLATPTFLILGLTVAWSLHRYGYALLAPTAYSAKIVETMQEGLVMIRLDGRIRSANSAFAKLVGCDAQQLLGTKIRELLDCEPFEWLQAKREVASIMTPLEGSPFEVSLSIAMLEHRDLGTCGAVVVVRDQREIAGLRERLVLSGRMAAVGELAAGVAHEINNPVAYVRSNLVLLRGHWDTLRNQWTTLDHVEEKDREELQTLLAEGEELIDESLEGINRTAAIVRGIRDFSHAGGGARERANLNLLVEAAHRMATAGLKPGMEIRTVYGQLPETFCSPGEIQQVILNLLINALDAIDEAGVIRVETRHEGNLVVISVHDDGPGIERENLARIFDPFFTTKTVGEGTGLGLSISYEIITRHGGEISVESTFGPGTTFRVSLPVTPDA